MDEKNQNQANSDHREVLDERMRKIEEYLTSLRRELGTLTPPVKDFIVKHPIGSLSTILGVGVVIGYLIRGNRRGD